VGLTDFLLQTTPQALPRWYGRLAGRLLAGVYEEIADRIVREEDGNGRVLDFGTGPGELPVVLARHPGLRIDAVDVSDNMLMAAEDRARETGATRVRFGLVEGMALPFDGQRYDWVVSTLVLHELKERAADWLSLLFSRLRPGGTCLLLDLHRSLAVQEDVLLAALREEGLLPSWLPRGLLSKGWRALHSSLPTLDSVDALLGESRFGLAAGKRLLPLSVGSIEVQDALLWVEAKAPDVTIGPFS